MDKKHGRLARYKKTRPWIMRPPCNRTLTSLRDVFCIRLVHREAADQRCAAERAAGCLWTDGFVHGGNVSSGAQNRPVMGAPKPAILRHRRFAHYRMLSALAPCRNYRKDGESTQDDGSTRNSGTCMGRMVRPAHRAAAWRSPEDGGTPSSSVRAIMRL
jgi:hypothetical protein